jgi:hypothetical protein
MHFIERISPYRAVNTFHHGYKNQSVNDVHSKVAVCSEIRTKHSTQSEHYVEFFLILSLVEGKETARL